jgi:NAD(P)H-dependent FMN reductase
MKLQVIIGSTRPGRITERLAKWVAAEAKNLPDTTVELVDLADYPMPFMYEAVSPRFNPSRELDPTVTKWINKVAEADAYIFVTAEYNHSIPGVLKNALDYLTFELTHKPATAVAHGTVGGARAIMHLKEILSESQAAVTPKAVALHGASEKLNDKGVLDPDIAAQPYGPLTALHAMLDELKWYSDALSVARTKDELVRQPAVTARR